MHDAETAAAGIYHPQLSYDGDVSVMLPDDSGFEPGEDIVIIKIGVEFVSCTLGTRKQIQKLAAAQVNYGAAITAEMISNLSTP